MMDKPDFAKNKIEVMRAEEEWQRTGAYSVRIEGMNRQHHISLREEFDEHDGPESRYIVLLDDGYPVATCRFFEATEGAKAGDSADANAGNSEDANAGDSVGAKAADSDSGKAIHSAYAGLDRLVMIGRMVVLPEYRGKGLGAKTIMEAEQWIRELGYENIGVDSRVGAVGFYENLGYRVIDPEIIVSGPFECKCMTKHL